MLWFKVFHILFVIAWMAGIFYLPRILVHHAEGLEAGEDVRRLATMAEKLHRFAAVMGVLAALTGAVLWLHYGIFGNWLIAKLFLVGLLVVYQLQTRRYLSLMQGGGRTRRGLFFRIYNEFALLIVVPVLVLVIMKPF